MTTVGSNVAANESGRREALRRFGYSETPARDPGEEYAREWALLAPGIAPWLAEVPLGALTEAQRDLAVDRVLQRRNLDELMRACDLAHARIAACGATAELVEAYASVRDRFEEAVEKFTATTETLAARFRNSP
jgi:hypothetical protein